MGAPIDRTETFSGAGSRNVELAGRFIRVLAADASGVTITPRGGKAMLRYAGQDIDLGPQGFQAFSIAVTVASTVRICVSDTRQADSNTNVSATVSATVTPAGTVTQPGDVICPAGAATQLIAGNANGLSVLIRSSATNNYADGLVRVGTTGVTASQGVELNVGESWPLATTAPLAAYNNSPQIATTVTAGSATISANNNFIAGQPVQFTGSFGTVTGLGAGTTYYVSATGLSATQFEVSAANGGAVIVPGGTGTAGPTVAAAVLLQVLPLAK